MEAIDYLGARPPTTPGYALLHRLADYAVSLQHDLARLRTILISIRDDAAS
jgi:hypothetical protein